MSGNALSVISSIIQLLAGMGVFLFGMQTMSDGLEKSAGKSIRKLFSKISNNRLIGVSIGTVSTAVVQSSTAVSVMVLGFVNAGIMNLYQSTAIIMGANIGTTFDSLLYMLNDFPIAEYLMLLAPIGVVMLMVDKKGKLGKISEGLIGLGLLFIGLELMSSSFSGSEPIKAFLTNIFLSVNNPLLLIIIGMVVTAILHSSSLVTAIIILLVSNLTGGFSVVNGFYIILGSNMGTCFTALVASIGTNVNAKRTAFIHFFFNFIGVVLFLAFMLPAEQFFINFFTKISGGIASVQIAFFSIIFNILSTIIFLPFIKQIVWVSEKVVKDKSKNETAKGFTYLDERFLESPSIALEQVLKEIVSMFSLARNNLDLAMKDVIDKSDKNAQLVEENENKLDFLNHGITNYITQLSSHNLSATDEKLLGALYHVVSDIERIGDHALNCSEFAQIVVSSNINLSEDAIEEIKSMYQRVAQLCDVSQLTFEKRDKKLFSAIAKLEDEIDDMKKKFTDNHIARLRKGGCAVESSSVFFELTTNLERIGDHLTNIAYSIVPKGNKTALPNKTAQAN